MINLPKVKPFEDEQTSLRELYLDPKLPSSPQFPIRIKPPAVASTGTGARRRILNELAAAAFWSRTKGQKDETGSRRLTKFISNL